MVEKERERAMTIQTAIDKLNNLRFQKLNLLMSGKGGNDGKLNGMVEALDIAIDALKNLEGGKNNERF
ncbi:MAG: hypothetical protein LLG05_18850 [Porphyromonadaceae bacterium]|nr:hypothetical protein [Porphyromonadaceae bacterium]